MAKRRDLGSRVRLGVVITWLALTCASLFVPLTNTVGYEFSFVQSAISVLLAPFVLRGGVERSPWQRFAELSAILAGLIVASGAIGFANAVFVRNCAPLEGVGWLAVQAIASVPLTAALWILCCRLGASFRGRVAWYFSLVSASVVASGGWLATQPPLVVYDAFFGFFSSSFYDESIASWASHIPFRAMTTSAAIAWVGLLAWESNKSRRSLLSSVVALGVLLFCVAQKGELNIARSRTWTQEFLGGFVRTPHFDIYYDASLMRDEDLVQLIADHESRYEELKAFWNIEPPLPLKSYIYGSRERRAEAMGSRNTMIARIWLREMHLVWSGPTDGLLAHEMSHLFLHDAGHGPLRLAAWKGVFPLMGLVEGSASAAAWEADELTEHGWAAAILRLGLVESPAQTLGASGFWSSNSGVVYTLWGSFSRWLIESRGGPELYLRAYKAGDFASAYGESLEDLLSDWESYLSNLPIAEELVNEAALRFGRPTIFQRECARALAKIESDAREAISKRQRARAAQCLSDLERFASEDAPLRFRIAVMHEHLDDEESARRVLESIVSDDSSGPSLIQNARLRLADLWWRQGDYSNALSSLDSMEELPITNAMERNRWVRSRLIEERSERPKSEAAGRRYLAESWRYRDGDMRMDLIATALEEDSAPGLWLAFIAGSRSPSVESVGLLVQRLEKAEIPEAFRTRLVLQYSRWLLLRGDVSGCSILRSMATSSENDADGVAANARTLYHRCSKPGLYLDAARRAVE